MKTNEYVKTIVVYGKMVNVGMDDYGQQYFIEFLNDDGEIVEVGCGAYNHDYEDVAKWVIDHERYSQEFWGYETWKQMQKEREERLKKYKEKEKLDDTGI